MREIKLSGDKDDLKWFNIDVESYEENLTRDMAMMNRSVDSALEKKLSKEEIDKWINALETWKNRCETWKVLKKKIANKTSFSLNDDEYRGFVRFLIHEIELSGYRIKDFEEGLFSWAEMMLPHEQKNRNMLIELYERLEGKKYEYNEEEYLKL